MSKMFNIIRTRIREVHTYSGCATGICTGAYVFAKCNENDNEFGSIVDSLIYVPETIVGCVSGYFWIYTLPPLVLYKKYIFFKNYKQSSVYDYYKTQIGKLIK